MGILSGDDYGIKDIFSGDDYVIKDIALIMTTLLRTLLW
jgi:hypothetical protein